MNAPPRPFEAASGVEPDGRKTMKVLTAKRETLEAIKPFQLVKYLAL